MLLTTLEPQHSTDSTSPSQQAGLGPGLPHYKTMLNTEDMNIKGTQATKTGKLYQVYLCPTNGGFADNMRKCNLRIIVVRSSIVNGIIAPQISSF